MLGQLVIACLSPDASRTPNQRLALQEAKRLMIKSFIETNLHSPELGPGFICQHCGISQSRLYALFPDEGGIANYIWSRRLERAAKDLQDTGFAHLSVGEIAENAGFTRHSHFSTAFKRRFGMTAKDWRGNQSLIALSANKDGPIFLVDLMRQFSNPHRPYPLRSAPSISTDFYLK